MNKILVIFLLLGSFVINAQEILKVGILNDKKSTNSELLLSDLKSEITSVMGQNSTVEFHETLYNDLNLNKAKENYNILLQQQVDVIVSFGVINTIMLYREKQYQKPVIMVGAINNDLVDIPKDQISSNIDNLTYIITPFSYREDLESFSKIYPSKNIGVIVDDYLLQLLPLDSLFDSYFNNEDVKYQFIPIAEDTEVSSELDNVDAVYLVSYENLSQKKYINLIQDINQKKIASFSALGYNDVENGILATLQPKINFNQIFRRIALNIESINEDVNAAELPLYINYKRALTINLATAELIDFHVKNSLLATTNLLEGTTIHNAEVQYSLYEIMNGVLNQNLGLEADRKNVNLSEQDLKTSKSLYLPDLTANVNGAYVDPKVAEISNGQNPEISTAGNLSLNQVVYSEQASANISIQKSLLLAQKEDFNASQLDILLNSASAYFNALILKTNVSIQNKNLQLTRQNLDIANENFQLGASGKSDVLRFRSQLAQNTQSLIEARNHLHQAYYDINQLLNNPIAKKIEIQDTAIDGWTNKSERYNYLMNSLDDPARRTKLIDFFIHEAKKNAPELKSINYNTDVVQRTYRLNNNGRYIPTVALQGQYNYLFSKSGAGSSLPQGYPQAPDGSYNVGLNVSLPIFYQNTRNIDRQSARIQEEQLNLQTENIELNIEKGINDITLDLVNQIANIEISQVNLKFSKESLELSQNEYKNGVIPVIQLIDAQNNYVQAFLANATAKYNYLLVSMQLQRSIGFYFVLNTDAENQEFIQRAEEFILNRN